MRRLTALAAVAVLAGCGSRPTVATGLAVRVDTSPFRVALLENGKTLVAEDAGARLRYQLAASGEQHRLTRVTKVSGDLYTVATDEPGRHALVTVEPTPTGVRIHARLVPAAGVQQVYDAFGASPGDHFLGGGERTGPVDLRGQVLSVKVSESCAYAPVPFFMSSAGWGAWLENVQVSALAFPGSPGGGGCRSGDEPQCAFPPLRDRVEVCVRGADLTEDLYAGDFPRVLADYEADAGRPRVPPLAELALVQWRGRTVFTGPGDLLEDVRRFRAAGVPIGWVLLDDVWQDCMGTLRFDRSRFPDPAGLVRRVHALGVRFMLWISPKVVCHEGYPADARLGPADDATLDLRRPAVAAEFERRLRALAALGIDGVKGDRGDETDVEPYGEALPNGYPVRYARDVVAALPRGSAILFRAAFSGSQAVLPGIWAGDQTGDWAGLQAAIRSGLSAGASGFPTWGSDVGGYDSAGLTAEVFARWAQLGAVSPVLEVGGGGPNATPWTLGPEAMAALRAAAVLHYELVPYFQGLLARGLPVLEPLAYAYPDDPGAWRADLELVVGPDLVAAPVAGAGTTPSVYLPAGRWVDLFTGAVVAGGGPSFIRATPLMSFPLYVRDGAVLPFNLRTARDSWWGVDELEHPGRAGYLATSGATLDLRGQPRAVQLFVPAPRPPRRVTLGGRSVPWTWNAGPLPGVVVRLHGPTVRGRIALAG